MISKVGTAKRKPKMQIFVQLAGGKPLTLNVAIDATVSELKGVLCEEHGFLPGRQCLHDGAGLVFDDTLGLRNCGITKGSTVHLSVNSEAGATTRAAVGSATEAVSAVDDASGGIGVFALEDDVPEKVCRLSEDDLCKAMRNSLSRAMTAGGLHVKELSSNDSGRVAARRSAQQKATNQSRRPSKDSVQVSDYSDLASLVQHIVPDLFVRCRPSLSTNRSACGGA
jgi:hypothetical protein